jgi:hypothetical protein
MTRVTQATVRDGDTEWHVECRFDDGQKFAAVTVDKVIDNAEGLAEKIAGILNGTSPGGANVLKKKPTHLIPAGFHEHAVECIRRFIEIDGEKYASYHAYGYAQHLGISAEQLMAEARSGSPLKE